MGFFGNMLQGGGAMPGAMSGAMPGQNPAGAQSFTSPPVDPQILAMLSALAKQQDAGQQQPQFQPPQAAQPVQPGQQAPGPGGMPPGLQAAIEQLKNLDPQTLKAIFARLGQQGQQGQQPSAPPPVPMQMPGR